MPFENKKDILKQYFGYDSFKEGQEYLIDSILSHKDVVGVMPTGAGKSICFQVPAMLLEGITIVISPLISLMKDQVNALTQAGIKSAFLNSSLTTSQYNMALENASDGIYKIIYVAPERLLSDDFLLFAQTANISMLTVDEAHCISQWGQDFRPSYIKIADFIDKLPKRPIVSAFTATATATVREDIAAKLKLENPEVLVTGFDRKNLYFEVQKPKNKFEALTHFLREKQEETGIVYCSTRKAVEEVCDRLNDSGYSATRYHAGLTDNERKDNQNDFTFDKVKIIVATNAFGMGIDKSNVSYVVHYNMPKNIESYYQEAGRAGRDGEPANCILLYNGQDVRTNMYFIENSKDEEYTDEKTHQLIKSQDRERLKKMTFYCHTNECLREYILKYFGEASSGFCGNCSNCKDDFETLDITVDAQKILSCVYRAKERFGIKMIIDILRGSKIERISKLGLDKLSTYNIMETGEKQIRDIINHLVLNEFLMITNDEYPLLKLGLRANEVLRDKKTIKMKLPKEIISSTTKSKPLKLHPVNSELLSRLKQLRLSIANQQKVPSFVIFSDSTLTDMCMKLPNNDDELLDVSGVGKVKLERYGEQFLKAIAEYVEVSDIDKSEFNDKDKRAYAIEQIDTSEPVTISGFTDKINCYLLQIGENKVSAIKITQWLVYLGYLIIKTDDNGAHNKIPTEKGLEIGIFQEHRTRNDGNEYNINLYNKSAQQFMTQKLDEILLYVKSQKK